MKCSHYNVYLTDGYILHNMLDIMNIIIYIIVTMHIDDCTYKRGDKNHDSE